VSIVAGCKMVGHQRSLQNTQNDETPPQIEENAEARPNEEPNVCVFRMASNNRLM